jgi:hypothetical protein
MNSLYRLFKYSRNTNLHPDIPLGYLLGGFSPDLSGGRPGTSELLKTARAGFFVRATWAVVAAVEMAAVPHTKVVRSTNAASTAEIVSDKGGHTAPLLY